MRQGPHQLHQVCHHRPQRQRHQVHRAAAYAFLRQAAGQVAQMAACPHQHGDGMFGPLVVDQRLAYQVHRNVFSLRFRGGRALARPGRVKAHSGFRQRFMESGGRAVGDGSRRRIAAPGQQLRKRLVDPFDDARLRAEVVGKVEEIRLQFAYADVGDFQEQAHFRLAETVDGLHRVAHQEQTAAVALLPARGQRAQQVQLGLAGVLEFVDEQMADRGVQLQQQFARIVGAAQRGRGALRDFDEIHLARVGEAQPQLRHRQRQRHQLRAQHFPLRIGEMWRGHVAHRMQAAYPDCIRVGGFQPRHERILVRALGRKAQVLVDGLAQGAGARQQQMRHGLPELQRFGVRRRLFCPVQQGQQLVFGLSILQIGGSQPRRAA